MSSSSAPGAASRAATGAASSAPILEAPVRQTTFSQDVWRRFRRSRVAVLGAFIIVMLVLIAVFADVIAPYSPTQVQLNAQFEPPSLQHPFGTDYFGRDILSRVIYGARISLLIGLVPTFIAMFVGTVIGVTGGFKGGRTDTVLMRLGDIVMAFPSLILAMVVTYTLGASLFTLFIALSVVGWAGAARVVRSQTLSLKQRDFVTASRAVGVGQSGIMFRHIIPNCLAPILILLTLGIPGAIMAEAGLSFLGVGAQPPTPSWGLMVNEGQEYLFSAPWAATFPGLAILVTVLAFNFVGDGLRDALDPFLKGRM
jgi:peptide/nickel transport system permease protein/oligopeptide transport system permease protein